MFLLCLLSQKVPHRPMGTLVGRKRDNWDGRKDSGSLPSCLPASQSARQITTSWLWMWKQTRWLHKLAWCGRARPCDKVNPPCVRGSGCFLRSFWQTLGIDSSSFACWPSAFFCLGEACWQHRPPWHPHRSNIMSPLWQGLTVWSQWGGGAYEGVSRCQTSWGIIRL